MSEKNGGPYTRPEQEERRRKVYEMHFEKSKSALFISEELGVNRHTIEDDIKYWYSELSANLEKLNVQELFARQYDRIESQRARLTTLLEKQEDAHLILKIEKMILEIDHTITKMLKPIIEQKKEEIPRKEAIEIAEHLILDDEYGKATGYSDVELLRDITKYKDCDILHAQKILDSIKEFGLELFKYDGKMIDVVKYDLLGFAESRNILSGEKLQEIYSKMEKREQEHKEEIYKIISHEKEVLARFVAKYGPQVGWPRDVWLSFDAESSGLDSIP